jgi:MATE family multidrug resistance protein
MDTRPTSAATAPVASSKRGAWIDELRATFFLAWPLVVAQLAQNLFYTTDVIMMGWLGPNFLAAGALASAFMMPILLLGIGIVGAVAPLVAQARGARDIKAVRRVVRQGFWASAVLAAVLIPVLYQIRPIFALLGQDPETTLLAETYIQIAAWAVVPQLLIIVLRSLLSAFDATRAILVVTVTGVIINAGCNYLLIFGNFGFPRLELRGAAISTVAINCLMFGLLLLYVLRHPRFKRFHILVRLFKPDWRRFREIFVVGTPIGMTILAEVSLFSAAALLMGRLGTDEVAAHAVALQCASTAFMVPLGIGMATTVRVGVAYGRNDPKGVGRAGWIGLVVGTGFMVFSALLFLTNGEFFLRLFLDPAEAGNANALRLAATYLIVAGVFQVVDGAQVVAAHALRGLSDTAVPMVVALVGYWAVGMPIAWLGAFVFDWEGVGIWIGLAAGLAAVAVVLVARFAMRERLGLMAPRAV